MADGRTLHEWLEWGRGGLEGIYQQELGRSAFSDPEAFVNWTYHWREHGSTDASIRAAIRTSPEWQQRHGGQPTSPDVPSVPPPVPPISGDGRVIRVTSDADGRFAPRMMSDRSNAFIQDSIGAAFVFCGASTGPQFFQVDIASGRVDRLGQIVAYGGETEGWYWTPTGRVVLPHGPYLLSVNPFDPADERILLDIRETHPGHDLWQPHSSDDGRTHSATVRRIVDSGRYPYVGTVIQGPHGRRFEAARGQLDESQVTRSGSHVVIKENGEDNRIIDLASGEVWDVPDADGAIGHSDCGPDFIVGEQDRPGPGRCVKLYPRSRDHVTLFRTDNMGYVSVRGGKCLHSGDTHLSLVDLHGGGLTPLIAHGGGSAYDDRVKANLDPSGRVATYMVGGAVYLLVVP